MEQYIRCEECGKLRKEEDLVEIKEQRGINLFDKVISTKYQLSEMAKPKIKVICKECLELNK